MKDGKKMYQDPSFPQNNIANQVINVTKTYLPPLEEYNSFLQGIWERNWVTNYGPLVLELENKLKNYLGVKHLFFVNNGTIAIQVAIKALEIKKEIITTPFSYIATASSIVWQDCIPIFSDIDPETLCINPNLIENSITSATQAILATHVYGNPCQLNMLETIARKHNLKLIYDAAHAFGVNYKGKSILNYGDISTLSFHGTKIFHTIEGGAIITNDDELAHKISYMINFGHNGPEEYWGLGINGKNSEFHAAMGLCLLPKFEQILQRRKDLCELYDRLLWNPVLTRPRINNTVKQNYGYYPLIFPNQETMLKVKSALNDQQIYPRRYFFPALNTLDFIKIQRMEVAEAISSRILCLPLYYDLTQDSVMKISLIINENS